MQYGAIAQLVEHLHGMQGVSGSNPLGSILKLLGDVDLVGLLQAVENYHQSQFLVDFHRLVRR
jgi:hypothetical protein